MYAVENAQLPAPGEVLGGKFRVERVLGRGGFGVVVAATHLHLREQVALKFLLPAAMSSAQVVERFLREAQAAVRIKSEHVARVSDVGTLDGGRPYMVMELLQGNDLSDYLRDRGPLSGQRAASWLLQALEAVAEAHALGIVHRDLKPANLFLARRADGSPLIKVLDFGISKVTEQGQAALTATGAVMGSPLYMSPEQLTDMKLVDARSDIWSLGVVLYELVTGRLPFPDDGQIGQLVAAILGAPPFPMSTFVPDPPRDIEAVVQKCLQKSPTDRFQTVGQLAEALGPIAGDEGRISMERARNISRSGIQGPDSQLVPSTEPQPRARTSIGGGWDEAATGIHNPKKSNLPLVATALIGVLAVGVGATWVVSRTGKADPPDVPPVAAASDVPPAPPGPPPVAVPTDVVVVSPASLPAAGPLPAGSAVKPGKAKPADSAPKAADKPAEAVPAAVVAAPPPAVVDKPKPASTGRKDW